MVSSTWVPVWMGEERGDLEYTEGYQRTMANGTVQVQLLLEL